MRTSVLLLVSAVSLAACSRSEPSPQRQPTKTAAPTVQAPRTAALQRVEASKVCMMNNHFMNAPQIPVQVEGKTYYGCCAMCEQRLRQDPNTRFSMDPVTLRRVDKAHAVIAKLSSGKVLYFENEDSLRRYRPS